MISDCLWLEQNPILLLSRDGQLVLRKYDRPGGNVVISLEKLDSHARLTIRDSGIGISHKDQKRIFERFYRVDKSHSKAEGGTGLGLSIVKHGVKLHNAKIEIESIVDEGTMFTIIFKKVLFKVLTKE